MSTEMGVAVRPSASLTDDELHLMMEYDKIVKLSESITSGKHPRIKIPSHLAPASTNLPARPDKRTGRNTNTNTKAASQAATAPTAAASQVANGTVVGAGTHAVHLGDNLAAFGQNSQLSAGTVGGASLPGLSAASGIRPVSPSVVSIGDIPLQRARVEALLREPSNRRGNIKLDEVQGDFAVGDVFMRGRELEKTFTPPPVAILLQDAITNLGGAPAKPKANVASSAAAESGDDHTFYSSNFSTPEFALTSRVPAESDNDDMSMQDGSDYEPELDIIPPPQQTVQQTVPQPDLTAVQHAPADQLAAALSQLSGQAPADLLSTLLAANIDPASLGLPLPPQTSANPTPAQIQQAAVAALSAWPGLAGAPQTAGGGNGSSSTSAHPRVAAGNPQPSSPFVRTHDLSPIAPQPAHISALAVASQLPLSTDGQSGSQGTLAQVALLRRGEASQSSPDSSPYIDGRAADKGKGKNKNVSKRKADVAPSSPYIKPEPRSPSPILAPPAQQRPPKRQKQDARPPPREVVYHRHEDEYSPAMQPAPYGTARAARDPRAPIIYERVDRGRYVQPRAAAPTRRASVQRYEEQRNLEGGYEQSSPAYAPSYLARPPSRQYAAAPGQPNLRPVRAATHALVETSSGYPAQIAGDYDGSGRMSVRPVAMAPPPRERIVIDEFGLEYYEPVAPAPRQQVVETVAYDPNMAYERPASRQPQIRYNARYGSQAPQPVYDDEEIVYSRTSPVFVAPRRVVTQPEYVAREYAGYPRREYSARPPSQYPAAAPERGYMVEEAAPPPGYLARASTAHPSEAARYEAPPPGRYVERVGSVRPPDGAVYQQQGYAGGPEDGQQHIYGGPAQGGAYIEDHRGPHEVIREYSVRPEPHVAVHGEYGARPGPAPPYYAEQPPQYVMGGPPAQEYGYPDERGPYQ